MRKEIIKKCAAYYVLNGESRVRTFPSEETMERWVRKFERENGPDSDDNWIDLTIKDFSTLQVRRNSVRLVRYGE